MIETILRKRASAHVGEVGLFASTEFAEEDLRLIGMGNDVTVTVVSEAAEKTRKFMWVLAGIVAQAVEGVHDKDDGMELLCVKCRHVTNKLDPVTGKLEIKRKSTLRIDGEAQRRLLARMIYVTHADIIPGIGEGPIKAELERIAGDRLPTEATPGALAATTTTMVAPKPEKRTSEAAIAKHTAIPTPPGLWIGLTTAAEYIELAECWIDAATSRPDAQGRFSDEMALRMKLGVTAAQEAKLQARLDRKFGGEK